MISTKLSSLFTHAPEPAGSAAFDFSWPAASLVRFEIRRQEGAGLVRRAPTAACQSGVGRRTEACLRDKSHETLRPGKAGRPRHKQLVGDV